MTVTVSIEEAQSNLRDLIKRLAPGDELVITDCNHPIAKLISEQPRPALFRKPGLGKGMITVIEDDDLHLEDFAEYMQ